MSAAKVWQLRLAGTSGASHLIDKSPTIVGQSAECDVVINHPSIAARHLQFTLDGRQVVINQLHEGAELALSGKPIKKATIKSFLVREYLLGIGDLDYRLAYEEVQETQPVAAEEDSSVEEGKWFYASSGQEFGPLTTAQIFEAIDCGALRPTDDFWEQDSTVKRKAFEVDGLFEGGAAAESAKQAGVATGLDHQCPYCWHRFGSEDVLFIAGHSELLGDSVLGSDEPQRFLPARFTAEGLAIDAKGVVCPDMACPRCHLRIPPNCLDHQPLILSVVGAPGSGKSYFLASAIWALRTTLPRLFDTRFMDADASTNRWLNDYEEKLFFQPDHAVHQSIAKTELAAPNVSREVFMDGMSVRLPLPSIFSVSFKGTANQGAELVQRSMILYDSAGEHFQAGADTAQSPVTKHLIHAEGIVFLFDPTEDPRFRSLLKGIGGTKAQRQDVLLVEMVARIRKHLGIPSGGKLAKTIVLGISKADLLTDHLPLEENPWRVGADGHTAALDLDAIHRVSAATRALLDQHAPEIVTTVETFAEHVVYIPNSALGHNPQGSGVRPCDIKPHWVEVPFLYVLAQRGYLPVAETRA